MSAELFNPYHQWLGIPPSEQPADHYRLLGLERFEANPDVIQHAADRQMAHVRSHQLGQYAAYSQTVLNALAAARVCLLNPQAKSAYDAQLRPRNIERTLALPRAAPVPIGSSGLPESRAGRRGGPDPGVAPRTARARWADPRILGAVAACVVLGVLAWWASAGGNERAGPRDVADQAGATPAPPPPAPPLPNPDAQPGVVEDAAPTWLDATTETAMAGPVGIRVLSAQLGKPRVQRMSGRAAVTREPYLIITLELTNHDTTHQVVYTGWGGSTDAAQRPALADNHGNRYETKRFAGGTFEGQQRNAAVQAGQPLRDVLVFERPVPAADHLRLTLPASALAQDGLVRFVLPKNMFEPELVQDERATSPASEPLAGPPQKAPPPDAGGVEPARPPVPQWQGARKPVPVPAKQQELRRVIEDIYSTTRPRSREETRALAAQLAALAAKAADPAERFVLLRRASELASEAGDARGMLQLVAGIAEEYDVDRLSAQAAMLEEFASGATSRDAVESLVVGSASVIDAALDAERFDLADKLSAAVHRASQTPAGQPFRGETLSRRQEIQDLCERWKHVQAAQAALESNPRDAAAHTVLGRWYGCVRDDWDQALPHWAKGSVPELQALADRELNDPPQDPMAQVSVADAWWDLAQTSDSESGPAWSSRAAYWYEKAWPAVTSPLLKERVRKRLEGLGRPDPELAGSGSDAVPLPRPGLFPSDRPHLGELLGPSGGTAAGQVRPSPDSAEPGDACPTCNGDGIVYNRCPNRSCARGTVRDYRYDVVGVHPVTRQRMTQRVPIRVPCQVCRGNYITKDTCSDCSGRGKR